MKMDDGSVPFGLIFRKSTHRRDVGTHTYDHKSEQREKKKKESRANGVHTPMRKKMTRIKKKKKNQINMNSDSLLLSYRRCE